MRIYKRAWTDYFDRYRENFKGDGKEGYHPESRGGAKNKVYSDLRLKRFHKR